MKNLYAIIILLLFSSITFNGTDDIQIFTQEIQDIASPCPDINFDAIVAYLSEKWQLSNLEPFVYPSLFNNYIARAYSAIHEQNVVVKISDSNDECKALQCLQNDGMVKLLDYDEKNYALLLQYIPDQGTLIDFLTVDNDDWTIAVFVQLFKKIHAFPKNKMSHDFKTVEDNFSLLQSRQFIRIPKNLLEKAMQISDELVALHEPHYLLHCDLHCRNILKFEDSFIAIDPWASYGPFEYEVASFLSSPTNFLLAQDNVQDMLQNRLNKLSSLLHLHKKRLKDYAFMRVMLLACMCEVRNKNDDWISDFIQIAELIDQLDAK